MATTQNFTHNFTTNLPSKWADDLMAGDTIMFRSGSLETVIADVLTAEECDRDGDYVYIEVHLSGNIQVRFASNDRVLLLSGAVNLSRTI